MPAQCVRHRYHRSVLHNYRRQCRMLSYAVFHRLLRHSQIMAHTLYIPDLFRQRFPGHRKCPRQNGITQRLRHIINVPSSFILPLHMSRPDLHRAPRWTEVSTGWSSMQECMHLRPLPEFSNRRTLFDVLISLCHLMAGQRGAAARAVRYDLEALIKKSLVPDFF